MLVLGRPYSPVQAFCYSHYSEVYLPDLHRDCHRDLGIFELPLGGHGSGSGFESESLSRPFRAEVGMCIKRDEIKRLRCLRWLRY